MKKLFYLSFVTLVLFSCENQDNVAPSIPVQDGIATRPLLPGDPNLNPNWSWESDFWVFYFSSPGGSISEPIEKINPFSNDPVYGNAVPSKRDMEASEGWMLVARDFGTPTSAPRIPWIMLYNRYRGLLRVCALRTTEFSTTYQRTNLSFDNSVAAPNLFRFLDESEQFATTYEGSHEWMVSEFNLQAYEPTINQQARLIVSFQEVTVHDVFIEAGGTIDGVAQPKPSKKSAIGDVYKISSYSSKFWDKLPELGNRTFKNIVKTIQKNPFALTSAASGIINGLTSAGKAPTYNISLDVDLSLTGTIKSSTPRGRIEVYLRDDAINSSQPKALQSIPWGVMNYNRKVPLTIEEFFSGGGGGEEGENDQFLMERIRTPSGFFNNLLVINPAISNDIASIEAGWIMNERNNVNFRSLANFKSAGYYSEVQPGTPGSTIRPAGVAVRITYNNGDFVYNRIPVQYTFM